MREHDRYHQQIEDCTWWAIEEIIHQLSMPENEGYIWIEHWNAAYAPYLGSLRSFLASRPDQFRIIPGKGKSFRVETAMPKSRNRHSWYPRKKQQSY
jgi:hypothetical protein